MAAKTRATAFSRFLILFALMAALFFGVQYVLNSTDWGQDLHEQIKTSAQEASPSTE